MHCMISQTCKAVLPESNFCRKVVEAVTVSFAKANRGSVNVVFLLTKSTYTTSKSNIVKLHSAEIPCCPIEFSSPNQMASFLRLFSSFLSSGVAIVWRTGHGLHNRPVIKGIQNKTFHSQMIGCQNCQLLTSP